MKTNYYLGCGDFLCENSPNEKFNNEYIENILEDENIYFQDKIQSFNDIIYKLSYDDRINLLNKYKYIFDQDDMQKNFLL